MFSEELIAAQSRHREIALPKRGVILADQSRRAIQRERDREDIALSIWDSGNVRWGRDFCRRARCNP